MPNPCSISCQNVACLLREELLQCLGLEMSASPVQVHNIKWLHQLPCFLLGQHRKRDKEYLYQVSYIDQQGLIQLII